MVEYDIHICNADYDFDMGDMLLWHLVGDLHYLHYFRKSRWNGIVMLFATGVIGLSFPWFGAQSFQFVGAVLYGSAKLVKQN